MYAIRESGDAYRVTRSNGTRIEVLDEGADVQPGSLALAGSRTYWTRGGQPKTSTG